MPVRLSLLFLFGVLTTLLLQLDGEAERGEFVDRNLARLVRVGLNFLDQFINDHLVHLVAELGQGPSQFWHRKRTRLIGVEDLQRLNQFFDGVWRLVHLIDHLVDLRSFVEALRASFLDRSD